MTELSKPQQASAAGPEPVPRVGARRRTGLGVVLLPLAGLLVALGVWWLLTSVLEMIHPAVLPPPGAVLSAFAAAPSGSWNMPATPPWRRLSGSFSPAPAVF